MDKNENLVKQYEESKRIIRQAMENHQLVLFVGAGASIASGMPSWGKAVKEIANRLSFKEEQLDYLRVPQYYFNSRGKKEYTQLMRNIFKHGEYLFPHEIHNRIICFNTETIITTNYDHLIERAAEDNSQIISVVSKDADLPYRKGGRELIKMHGDFENDNFVLKENDYLEYSKNFQLIENYVKSLIGTKVVLFIGYSFNDPDLKQIFSWAKNILGGDFQRAYLIESGKEYDLNEADYYRHFGINSLYASVQLSKEKYNKNDLTNNLLLMLKWLQTPEESDKLTAIYNECKCYNQMNYICQKYINDAFSKTEIRLDNGILSMDIYRKNNDDTEKIFKALAYEQWNRLGKNIILPETPFFFNNLADKKNIESRQRENNKNAKEYFDGYLIENSSCEKINLILDVLCKSNIIAIECHMKVVENTGWKNVFIPIEKLELYPWMDGVNTFDFKSLEIISKINEEHLSETNPDMYMQQGYIQYILGNYMASYNYYKNAKTIFYKRQEYNKFFIAEFNRYIIGMIMTKGGGIVCGVRQEDIDVIKQECDAINLDRLFYSLPDLGDSNKPAKDIYTFNVAYNLFRDAYQASVKIQEQAKTQYSFFFGSAAFAGMRERVEDYYNYISQNLLPVNNYSEHSSIFRIYFNSIVSSALTQNDIKAQNILNNFHNVQVNEILPFDILVALKFEDLNDLDTIFKGHKTNLPLSDDSLVYIKTVLEKCQERPRRSIFLSDKIFWKCVTILAHSNLSSEIVEVTIKRINEPIAYEDFTSHSNRIIAFLNNLHKQDVITLNSIKYLEEHIAYGLDLLTKDSSYASHISGVILTELFLLKENDHVFNDKKLLKKVISDETRIICVSMYPNLGRDCQKLIEKEYQGWVFDAQNNGFEFYYCLVNSGIIKPNIDAEKYIFNKIKNKKADELLKEGVITFPAQDGNTFCYQLLDLYIRDLIIDRSTCVKLLRERNVCGSEWLMDYKGYNYQEFDIKWLLLCSPKLFEEFCKEDKVKKHIKLAVEKAYNEGNVDQSIIDIYFKYFCSKRGDEYEYNCKRQ